MAIDTLLNIVITSQISLQLKEKKLHRQCSLLRISYFDFKEFKTPMRLFLSVT